jgi:large subunit ribosomal protein L10
VNRTEKEQNIESLHEIFKATKSAFLIDYRGLKVVDATELRRQIRKIASEYKVVKNTLALRATKGTTLECLNDYFKEPTAIALSRRDDAAALAKLLTDLAKTNPSIKFKAAMVEGQVFPPQRVADIAKLPSREELLAKFLFLLKAPITRLATGLNTPVRNLASLLKQVEDLKANQG